MSRYTIRYGSGWAVTRSWLGRVWVVTGSLTGGQQLRGDGSRGRCLALAREATAGMEI